MESAVSGDVITPEERARSLKVKLNVFCAVGLFVDDDCEEVNQLPAFRFQIYIQ